MLVFLASEAAASPGEEAGLEAEAGLAAAPPPKHPQQAILRLLAMTVPVGSASSPWRLGEFQTWRTSSEKETNRARIRIRIRKMKGQAERRREDSRSDA